MRSTAFLSSVYSDGERTSPVKSGSWAPAKAPNMAILLSIFLFNKNYYIDDNPKVSDAEYDKIKLDAIAFENKYSYLKKFDPYQ